MVSPTRRWAIYIVLIACDAARSDSSVETRLKEIEDWAARGSIAATKLREFLSDDAPEVRIRAASALIRIGREEDEALSVLREELRAPNNDSALVAALAIAEVGDRGLRLLADGARDGRARPAALQGLLHAAPLDVALLQKLRGVFREVLERSSDPRSVVPCLKLAAQDADTARACAPFAVRLLSDGRVAANALRLLDAAGPDRAYLDALTEFIRSPLSEVPGRILGNGNGLTEYQLASSMLCGMGADGVRAVLQRLGEIEFEPHVQGLLLGLKDNIETSLPHMLLAAKGPTPRLRQRVLGAVSMAEDVAWGRQITEVLLDVMLHDPDSSVRHTACEFLPGRVWRLQALPSEDDVRRACVRHPDEEVRSAALRCLLAVGKASVEFVTERLADPSDGVCIAAAQGLGAFGEVSTSGLPALLDAVHRDGCTAACVEALSLIAPGDPRVIEAICFALSKSDRHTSLAAVRAVSRVGKPAKDAAAALRRLPPTDDREVALERFFALWKVSDSASDTRALLEAVSQRVREHNGIPPHELERAVEILLEMGSESRSLVPVLDEVLLKPGLGGSSRRLLEEARASLVR